ncbi:polysaccharide biosynthesis/export family protein [Phenylobacterium sp.]|uniref:polysaccharide biosynthesis/export family protein n=1 Tax=Phenylobacterium sp. TaxID=1871053 RepID=UPI0038621281
MPRIPRMDLLGPTDEPAPRGRAFSDIPYATWSDYEPDYRFYPGDEIEVSLPSAPELNKTVTVQPDGRISLPLISTVMAADRTIPELQADLAQAYSRQLLRPEVDVVAKAAPLKVFVGGEVGTPGMFDLTGDSDALRAVIQAGDFKTSADRSSVIIIRRGPDGRAMMRRANLYRGLKSGASDVVPLRRFDIVYVPRSGVAEASLFIQQYFRDLSPVTFGFNYALGANVIN